MTKAGRVVAGKYRLERMLGRGGMGSVWLADRLDEPGEVALKILDPARAESSEARARFDREAKAAARLRSPYVARILDAGVDGELPFIVMEVLDGEDLGARLKRRGRLSLGEVRIVVEQATTALRLAHHHGVVHRDLKPSNFFLAREGRDELIKLLDFGIAKVPAADREETLTRTGALLGTVHYMSPEQLRDPKTTDPRSDLWSLAVLVFAALTGHEPFRGRTLGDTVSRICREPLPSACRLAPDLPSPLDAFFERAFSRSRATRFQSARELADAFAAACDGDADDDLVPTRMFEPTWVPSLAPGGGGRTTVLAAVEPMLPPAPPPPSALADAPSAAPAPASLHALPPPPALPSFAPRAPLDEPSAGRQAALEHAPGTALLDADAACRVTAILAGPCVPAARATPSSLPPRSGSASGPPRAALSPPSVPPSAPASIPPSSYALAPASSPPSFAAPPSYPPGPRFGGSWTDSAAPVAFGVDSGRGRGSRRRVAALVAVSLCAAGITFGWLRATHVAAAGASASEAPSAPAEPAPVAIEPEAAPAPSASASASPARAPGSASRAAPRGSTQKATHAPASLKDRMGY